MSGNTLLGVGNLIKLLPTGTIFLLWFLIPNVTNSGNCSTFNKYLIDAFLMVCGFNCIFASFTESYTGSDGSTTELSSQRGCGCR
ncbi:hypothetical protein E2542_SST01958 [Spatholobus suberectus]|nr:hypothetical protein E2542_SST01958 [Spatholobus suberectus]